MSVLDELARVAQGQRSSALLHTCRLDGFGSSFHGDEEILEAFRQRETPLDPAVSLIGERHAALVAADCALFADLHQGRIMRLWRVGSGVPLRPEPRIDVPFDPDLAQARGDFFFRRGDHPELAPTAVEQLRTLAHRSVEEAVAFRTRLFVLRAFSVSERHAALLMRYQLTAGAAPTLGFTTAVLHFETGGEHEIVEDRTGATALSARQWRPSFA